MSRRLAPERSGGTTRAHRVTAGAVVEAAGRIADTEGVDTVSLTRVASELGVTQPSLYRHVDGIGALRKAMALRARELLVAALTDAALGRTRDEAVVAVATVWRGFVRAHPGLYESTDRIATIGDADLEASVDQVVSVLTKALSGYRLPTDEQVHAARSLRSALHGFAVLEKDAGHPAGTELDESFSRLVSLLVAGITAMERNIRSAARPSAAR